jgi:hypothetical protein
MERNIKEEERLRSTKRADLARAMLGGRVQTPHRTTMPFFDPLIDPKSFKQEFLKGDKKCVFYCESFEPNTTSYTSTMRGL